MKSEVSRKIIVAGGMAVVVGALFVVFTQRSHEAAQVAQTPPPPTPFVVAQAPAAPAADGSTTPPATGSTPADAQKMGTSTEVGPSDSQTTPDVKSPTATAKTPKSE
jgi:hypothetical protein